MKVVLDSNNCKKKERKNSISNDLALFNISLKKWKLSVVLWMIKMLNMKCNVLSTQFCQ